MSELGVRERAEQKTAGRTWFDGLGSGDKWNIGDALVLGTFEWIDWFERKPSAPFMHGVEDARMHWEVCGAD